jgi:hypothetical protein
LWISEGSKKNRKASEHGFGGLFVCFIETNYNQRQFEINTKSQSFPLSLGEADFQRPLNAIMPIKNPSPV